ncbi:pro-neuregulin-1, membrane-bound isoform-like isoform X2 [Ptychodera flava]|uniref:pro-neuregulin-1, membrane-bound isoform-like isoform X2 n=1 Tax=Ptychodera flava TaxID=63121 RepID=UPI00396AA00A
MERNQIVIFLCALIAFCGACTTDSELSTELKTYKAPIVLEGDIQRTDENTNSVTVDVKKFFKPEETLEVIEISGFGTDEPCIINADELQIGETYILFIREDVDGSYRVEFNPVASSKETTRVVRKIACDGCAKPPSIRKQLRDKTVKAGAKFTLKCQVQGLPQPTVSWTKDGEVFSKGVKNSKKGSRFKVKKALKARDEGVYTCIADNGVERVNSSARINICDLTCENNGDLNLKKCSCSCKDGWQGDRCEEPAQVCDKRCHHGRLDKKKCECKCREGYAGEFCEEETCTKMCGDHGQLNVQNCTCMCDQGWSGDTCQELSSHLEPCKTEDHNFCLNGGTCYNIMDINQKLCHCPTPFTGTRCHLKDPHAIIEPLKRAQDLYTKRIITIVGVFVALLVLIIICIVAWCKARKGKKKWHKRQEEKEKAEKARQRQEKEAQETQEEKEKLMRPPGNQRNGDIIADDDHIPMQGRGSDLGMDMQGREQETSFSTIPPNYDMPSSTHQSPNRTGSHHAKGSPHQSSASYQSNNSPMNSRQGSPERGNRSHNHSPPNSLTRRQLNTNNNKNVSVSPLDYFKDRYLLDQNKEVFDERHAELVPLNREGNTPTIQETDSDLEDDIPRHPVAETEEEDSNMDDSYIYLHQQPREPLPEDAFKRPTLDSFEVQSNDMSLLEAEDGSVYTNEDTTVASDSDSESSSSDNSSSSSDDGNIANLDPRLLALQNPNSDMDSGDYAWDDEEFSPANSQPPVHFMANPYAVSDRSPVHHPRHHTASAVNHFANNSHYTHNPDSTTQRHNYSDEDNGNDDIQTNEDRYTPRGRHIFENQNVLKI